MRTPESLSYGHVMGESPAVEGRIDGVHNGNTSRNHHHHRHLQQPPYGGEGKVDLASDPVTIATIAPVSGRSNSTPLTAAVRYRECLRNHAASIGGNVFDGCGEFMPGGVEGTLEALNCAACECHRNFHRREVDGESQFSPRPGSRRNMMLSPLQLPPPLPSPSLLHHQKFSMGFHPDATSAPIIPPVNVAYGGNGGIEAMPSPQFALSKKRFRSKFTQEQKEKMLEFAEKAGWKIQKQDEEEVEKLCAEVGVKRQVLKVWMHNNKNSMKKQNETETETETQRQSEPGEGEGGIDKEM